jgi:hypothetical protein
MKYVVTIPVVLLVVTLALFTSIYPIIQWKPVFASPDTATFRPNTAGTYQTWSMFGSGSNHWDRTSDQSDLTGVQSPLWVYKQGSFTANTVTGNQIVDTGSGVVIKALILYGAWKTTEGFSAGESGFLSYIVSTTQRKCIAWASDDAVTTSNTGCGSADDAVLIFSGGTPTQDGLADFVSFGTGVDAGKFTITWSDAPSIAFIIHYVALGGDDLTNVFVGQYAAKTGSTGSVSYTGVGFQGDVILFSGISRTSIGQMAGMCPWMGAAKSSTARGSIFWAARDANTIASRTKHWQDTTKCVSMCNVPVGATPAINAKADFVSFDADGFTLSWTDYASSAWLFFVMVLKGGSYNVNTFTAPASIGAQSITTGFQPAGILFFGAGQTTADAALGAEAHVCIGAMGESPLEEGSIWTSADDTATTDSNKRTVTTKPVQVNTNPSTIRAEADATSLNSDGFTITWTTTFSGCRFFSVAFGSTTTSRKETENLADTSQTGTINSVTAYIRAKATGSGDEQAVILWRTYSTDYESSPVTISTTAFTDYSETRTTNPNTGASWTWTEVNALEIGSRASSLASGETIQVSEYWIDVEYTLYPPTNDQLTLDLTGASYKNTKTLLCAKQDYKFVYKCSDANGVTDITYAQIQLDPTGKNVILRATRGSGDVWTFSEYSDSNNYVTLNTVSSSHSTSGNQKTFNFLVTINWNWGDSAETVTVRCYVIDASSASDQDDYTDIFGVECHLTSASLVVSDYRCNPSQTSLTFSGYWYYDGTSIVPPDGNYAVVIKLSGVQKGSPDTTLVSGAFFINDVTAESTVNSYSYTVEATYMSGAGSFSAVIVDRIKVLSYTVSDSRANINNDVNIDATLIYESDSTAITTGTITINGYSASHIGSGVYRITRTSASVTSVTYNTVAGSESTYGLNTVNQNGQSTSVVWDRLQVQSYTVSDNRDDINDNVDIDALIWFDYDNTICTTATITINSYSATHIGSGVYRITRTSSTVTSVAYNTVACSAESTYGITTVDQNSQATTVIWDRIRIDSLSAVDSRVDINTQILFYATASLEFDSHPLGSGDSFTLSGYAFVWSAGNNRFEVTETKTTVTSVIIIAFTSGSEATYGITAGNINSKTITGIWDRLEFVSVSADDTRINVGGTFELRYQIRYGFDDVTFDNTKGSISGFTWDVANSWWDKSITGSSSVTSTTYDETYVTILDTTYGIAVKEDVAGVSVITDRIRIDSLSVIDSRIDINTQGTFCATASLEFDGHTLGSEDSLTLSGYIFSWVAGNNRFEYSSVQSSVTSITVNSFTSGNEATYGITTGNINSQTVTLVWDRIIVYWEQLNDSRVNIGTNIEGRYKAVLQFDNHAFGSGDSLSCSWGNLAWDNANNWFDLIHSESTVTGVTISGWGGNEATYGITSITENITETTYIYDRIEIYEKDDPIIVNEFWQTQNRNQQVIPTYVLFYPLLVCTVFSFLRIKNKKKAKAFTFILLLSFLVVIVPNININTVFASDETVTVNTYVIIWFRARYDYDKVTYSDSGGSTLSINATSATYNSTAGALYWYRNVTQSTPGEYVYTVTAISDGVYGLTTFNNVIGYITITFTDPPPTYSNVGTNSTLAGQPCEFYTLWNDNTNVSGFIFGTNNTGSWTNDTWVAFSAFYNSTAAWSNVTKTLNSTINVVIQWQIWCNDTGNNWNNTGIQTFATTLAYKLNLRVMDWDLTDAIANAYVTMNNETDHVQVSDSNGRANYTGLSGTVTVKVQYFGFWVNGTFSVTMDSDKTINVQCKLYDVTVLVQEGVQNAYLAGANVTVYNSTSVQGNKITSGVTGNNGQVQLLNLPNNTLTFTQYGGASYSLVIGNTTRLVSSENQTIPLTADKNNVNTNNNYSIIAFVGMAIPLKGSFITKRLKKKMQKRSETNEGSPEEVLS